MTPCSSSTGSVCRTSVPSTLFIPPLSTRGQFLGTSSLRSLRKTCLVPGPIHLAPRFVTLDTKHCVIYSQSQEGWAQDSRAGATRGRGLASRWVTTCEYLSERNTPTPGTDRFEYRFYSELFIMSFINGHVFHLPAGMEFTWAADQLCGVGRHCYCVEG